MEFTRLSQYRPDFSGGGLPLVQYMDSAEETRLVPHSRTSAHCIYTAKTAGGVEESVVNLCDESGGLVSRLGGGQLVRVDRGVRDVLNFPPPRTIRFAKVLFPFTPVTVFIDRRWGRGLRVETVQLFSLPSLPPAPAHSQLETAAE